MTTSRPRVLVIDDDTDHLQMLTAVLEEDFDVLVAADGLEGYRLACTQPPAVVVLDLMMPTVDGWTVLRKLRSNPHTKASKVMIVTAMDQDAIWNEATRLGVSSILRKPIDVRQLHTTVKKLASRG